MKPYYGIIKLGPNTRLLSVSPIKLLISFALNGILSKSEYVTTKCFTRGRFAIVEISVEPLAQDLYVDQVNVRLQFLPEVAQVAAA